MRVFAALPLPRAVVDAVSTLIAPIRTSHPRLRWVSQSAYHLTLHFFGEVDEGDLSGLRRVFQDPALKRPPFTTRLGPLGQFPPGGNPRVLWIALDDQEGQLRSYWELLESSIAPLGWERDRRGFTPHVTLARNSDLHLAQGWDAGVQLPETRFSICECVLFQSILGRGGAEYVALSRITFDGGAA
ncbi:MAG: RNA 2',3'-cyclic phosphodiesterase [Spirochaetia bacterium]